MLQGLVVSIEAERLDGGLRVCRRAAGDQREEGVEGRVVPRRGEGEHDGVPHVGSGLAERNSGGPGDVAVVRGQALHDEGHRVVGGEREKARERLREDARIVVAPKRDESQEQGDVGAAAGGEAGRTIASIRPG
jgi:hypothetical protein